MSIRFSRQLAAAFKEFSKANFNLSLKNSSTMLMYEPNAHCVNISLNRKKSFPYNNIYGKNEVHSSKL